MRKLLLLFAVSFLCQTVQAQTMQEKLYYTCKVWGFAKYYHSEVSVCNVNWDSVLLAVLPDVRSAASSTEFNDALLEMLDAAGPMALSSSYFPDTLPAELKRNRDFGWISSPTLRSDVKEILDTIKNNFRPHPSCQVEYTPWPTPSSSYWGGYLKFPQDSIMLDVNVHATFPSQDQKLLMFFKLWNTTQYFNPYNYVLDIPWDSTLYNHVVPFSNAPNVQALNLEFLKVVGTLDDAHVRGLSYVYNEGFPPGFYRPRIKLKYVNGNYLVIRSMEVGVNLGDAIVSVDGLTISQWTDSLSKYCSAGNPSVKGRSIADMLLRRLSVGINETLVLQAPDGTTRSVSVSTINSFSSAYDNFFYDYYYPADSLNDIEWTIFDDCNIGYMNFGNITDAEVDAAYAAMQTLPGIVLDIRNYPLSGNAWALSDKMYTGPMQFSKLSIPDVEYPGTYSWIYPSMGVAGNPTPYLGQVVVIVDETTQSAAEYTTMMLKKIPGCIVIGSQTAGADGNITWLSPAQDMSFGWTSLGVYYPNGDSTQRIGIVPDSFAYATPEGIRDHRDYVLEKALRIAGCPLSASDITTEKPVVSIYPNPANETITISTTGTKGKIDVVITDISGKVLMQDEVSNNATVDVSKLSAGMYFVRLKVGEFNTVKKMMKR